MEFELKFKDKINLLKNDFIKKEYLYYDIHNVLYDYSSENEFVVYNDNTGGYDALPYSDNDNLSEFMESFLLEVKKYIKNLYTNCNEYKLDYLSFLIGILKNLEYKYVSLSFFIIIRDELYNCNYIDIIDVIGGEYKIILERLIKHIDKYDYTLEELN